MFNFGLIGVGGYIAPRHLKAIAATGNNLSTCLDSNDSVGIIDAYFPEASFFTEPERFERHIDKLRRANKGLDYLSICSPNYLHDSHIRLGLRNGCNIICEKPIVVNPNNLGLLSIIESETGKKINNILQLRLHNSIIELKNSIDKNKIYDIDLTYITSRGMWYHHSWKANKIKSGGLAMNIGIHFFDMLIWIFGDPIDNVIYKRTESTVSGFLTLDRARVRWFLSIDNKNLPSTSKRTYRSIKIDKKEIEFSSGFEDLHDKSYFEILNGNGFGIKDVEKSLQISSEIMSKELQIRKIDNSFHALLRRKK
jgi:UDP-N-acetyl-2-amino-2-deoxyglucuronate dehydrogenase